MKYTIDVNGELFGTADFETGILKRSGDNTLTVKVVDSRGRSVEQSVVFSVAEYREPRLSAFDARRCNENGVAAADGSFVSVDISGTVASVNDKNTLTICVYYKAASDTSWTRAGFLETAGYDIALRDVVLDVDFNPLTTYNLKAEVSDYFDSATLTVSIGTKRVVMDFYKDGTAVAFGKIAEQPEVLEVSWPIKLTDGDVENVRAKSAANLLYLGQNVLTEEDTDTVNYWMSKGFCYVRFTEKQLNGQISLNGFLINIPDMTGEKVLTQIWIGQNAGGSLYVRYGDVLGFSDWECYDGGNVFDEVVQANAGITVSGAPVLTEDLKVTGTAEFSGSVEFTGEVKGIGEVYSQDEYVTGDTWIDGKPLYRKLLVITSTATGTWNYDISDLNHDYIRVVSDMIQYKYNNNAYIYWAQGGFYSGEENYHRVFVRDSALRIGTGAYIQRQVEYVLLEYTKA